MPSKKLRCVEDFQPFRQRKAVCDPSSHPTAGGAGYLQHTKLQRMENFRRFCCQRREPVYCPEGKGSARWRWDFLAPHNLSPRVLAANARPILAPLPAGARHCLRTGPSCGVQPGFGVARLDAVSIPSGTVTLSVGASPRKLAPERVPLTGAICGCRRPWAWHGQHREPAPNNAGLGAPTRSPGSWRAAGERFRRFSPASFPPPAPAHPHAPAPALPPRGHPDGPWPWPEWAGGLAGHGDCHMAAP